MVCIYCGSPTRVTNSRLQKQTNTVWRRRQCTHCKGIFTTHEAPDLTTGLVVVTSHKQFVPFERDKFFISIYECCKHRPSATTDASALTKTILARLVAAAQHGKLDRGSIIAVTAEVLNNFDKTAAAVYTAFHKD